MGKIVWNPLNPSVGSSEYERHVGDVIARQIGDPGFLRSLYGHLVNDPRILEPLDGLRFVRRTREKPRWLGASGCEHQIDESFSTEDERGIVLVECKHWARGIDLPAFSMFLIRVIDIAHKERDSLVFGMLVTTQGHKGRGGGTAEEQDCIAKLQTHFGEVGYPISIQWLPD